jgi:hypothetical protein
MAILGAGEHARSRRFEDQDDRSARLTNHDRSPLEAKAKAPSITAVRARLGFAERRRAAGASASLGVSVPPWRRRIRAPGFLADDLLGLSLGGII